MSNLSNQEKRRLERFLGMGGGYVLDFFNRTLEEFVLDSTGRDIYDAKYDYGSGSKANRLRAFWEVEPNYMIARLLTDLITYCEEKGFSSEQQALLEGCQRTVARLAQEVPVEEIEALSPNADGRDFELLAKTVRDYIEKNEPEAGIDRLHTFVVKYVRVLCEKHGIDISRDKPLHSMFGEYVKALKKKGQIRSEMAERILKSSISILEAFSHVRNNQSFAHDNAILDYSESLLIFNQVASSVRFISSIESSAAGNQAIPDSEDRDQDEIPF